MRQLFKFGVTAGALLISAVSFVAAAAISQMIWLFLFVPLFMEMPSLVWKPLYTCLSLIIGFLIIDPISWIQVFYSMAIWGVWAAIAYAFILRKGLGEKIRWWRVCVLHIWTVLMAYILMNFSKSNIIEQNLAEAWTVLIWFFTGLFIVRDWVVRP